MAFEERNTLTYLVISLLVAAIFGSRIYAGTLDGAFDGPDGLQIWARTVLWYIPFAIAMTIAGVILANILYGIVTGGKDLNMKEDERDKQFALRGMRVTSVVFSTGWIVSVIMLAMGWSALAALNMLLFSGWFSDLCANLLKLFHYRRGY